MTEHLIMRSFCVCKSSDCCGKKITCGYVSANDTDLGVIISALEVIEPGICIVIISTVAKGVDLGHGAGCGDDVAIGIVLIGCNCCTGAIHHVHYIALQVGDVIVGGSVVLQGIGVSVGIVREIQEVAVVAFPQQLAAGIEIIVGSAAADGFLGAQAVGVVLKGKRSACTACGGKLAAILPGEAPTRAVIIAQRIAGCIV